jgi:glycosyltransferase involved in cell wall biosynthesis
MMEDIKPQNRLKLSVVIAARDAAKYLKSVPLKLRPLNDLVYEIVIVDDGSVDESWTVIGSWDHENLQRVRNPDSLGVAEARNAALRLCRGEYIWFVDPDDTWNAHEIPRLVAELDRTGSDIMIANAVKVDANSGRAIETINDAPFSDIISGTAGLDRLLRGEIQGHLWNKVFRRRSMAPNPFPGIRRHEDLGGVLRLVAGAAQVSLDDITLYNYQIHAGSHFQSSDYEWTDLRTCLDIAERVAGNRDHPALVVFRVKLIFIPLAHQLMQRGRSVAQYDEAMRYLREFRFCAMLVVKEAGAKALFQVALIRFAWPLYRKLYLAHRRQKWGSAA